MMGSGFFRYWFTERIPRLRIQHLLFGIALVCLATLVVLASLHHRDLQLLHDHIMRADILASRANDKIVVNDLPACLADSCGTAGVVAFCGGRVSAFWSDGKWHDLTGKEIPSAECVETAMTCYQRELGTGKIWEIISCDEIYSPPRRAKRAR